MFDSALVWWRRDLRDDDHRALGEALRRARRVYCGFVFEQELLETLADRDDRRVSFIHASLIELDARLRQRGGGLIVRYGRSEDLVPALAAELGVDAVFANRDYEPRAKARDASVAAALQAVGRSFEACKDHVVFAGSKSSRPLLALTLCLRPIAEPG